MSDSRLVDLAQMVPEEMIISIGKLTVLFGRLEHMVLLAIKRKIGISLSEAQELYKGYSLGAKLFGKKACRDVGEKCQNYNSQESLSKFYDEVDGLKDLCMHIQDLTSKRNRFMHGLITTVMEETYLSHNKKTYELKESELWELENDLINTIAELNQLIPIPGLHASWASGPSLDVSYDVSATSGGDPIVKIGKDNDIC